MPRRCVRPLITPRSTTLYRARNVPACAAISVSPLFIYAAWFLDLIAPSPGSSADARACARRNHPQARQPPAPPRRIIRRPHVTLAAEFKVRQQDRQTVPAVDDDSGFDDDAPDRRSRRHQRSRIKHRTVGCGHRECFDRFIRWQVVGRPTLGGGPAVDDGDQKRPTSPGILQVGRCP